MKCVASLFTLVGLFLVSACERGPSAVAQESQAAAEPFAGSTQESPRVRIKTSMGDIVLELDAEKAPITVANFLDYVAADHYDGTVFHRVMNGFMIQGGGFALQDGQLVEKETGKGIKNESQNGLKNKVGTIAMARTADPNSATAQFFINVVDNQGLDYPTGGGYAVFGKVVEGMDIVNQIKEVGTGVMSLSMRHPLTGQAVTSPAQNVPLEAVVIESAEVVD